MRFFNISKIYFVNMALDVFRCLQMSKNASAVAYMYVCFYAPACTIKIVFQLCRQWRSQPYGGRPWRSLRLPPLGGRIEVRGACCCRPRWQVIAWGGLHPKNSCRPGWTAPRRPPQLATVCRGHMSETRFKNRIVYSTAEACPPSLHGSVIQRVLKGTQKIKANVQDCWSDKCRTFGNRQIGLGLFKTQNNRLLKLNHRSEC